MANTPAQKQKLDILVEAELLPADFDIIHAGRDAVIFAKDAGIISTWTDFGNAYSITLTGTSKALSVPTPRVGEFIVDKMIEQMGGMPLSEPKEVKPKAPKEPVAPKEPKVAKKEPTKPVGKVTKNISQ